MAYIEELPPCRNQLRAGNLRGEVPLGVYFGLRITQTPSTNCDYLRISFRVCECIGDRQLLNSAEKGDCCLLLLVQGGFGTTVLGR